MEKSVVVKGYGEEEESIREFLAMTELFYILVVVVLLKYQHVKAHRTVYQNKTYKFY